MNTYETLCKNSYLEKTFLNYLKTDDIHIISFDIFDTLVFRKQTFPKEVFKTMGEHSCIKKSFFDATHFMAQRVEAEKKARNVKRNSEEITLEDIYKQLPLSKKNQKKAIKLEIKIEKKSLCFNHQIVQWIKQAIDYNKKIVFISDSYFSKKQLETLIFKRLPIKIDLNDIFVSCEYGVTKATGNLYHKIVKKCNVDASTILHIGDNYYSDVQMALKSDLKALHYASSTYGTSLYKLEESMSQSLKHVKIKELALVLNPYKAEKEQLFFDLGAYVFGPVLWEFSHWLKKLAHEKKSTQINFVMREGKLFKQCFEMIDTAIKTNLVYASRKSTFLASLDLKHTDEMNFNFYQYRGLKIKELYLLFELKITHALIKKHQLESIENLHQNRALEQAIIEDFKLRKDEIIKNSKKQRKYLKRYLQELNYQKNSIIVDFGGTGTILKTINKVINNKKAYNVLFYCHEQGIGNLMGSRFFAFFHNQKEQKTIELIRRVHQLIEVLLNGNETTTLGYEQNSKIKILKDDFSIEMQKNKPALDAFKKGIESFFITAIQYDLKAKSFKKRDLNHQLQRLLEMPFFNEAKALGNLYYDKGIGKTFEKVVENRALDYIQHKSKHQFFYEYRRSLSFEIDNIVWPQAELTLYDKEFIAEMNRAVVKSMNAQSIEKIVQKLDYKPYIKEVYIYAAGVFFKELLPYLLKRDIKVKAVFDTRAKLKPFVFEGFEVKYLNDTIKQDEHIIIASAVFAKEIKEEINSLINVNIIDCL
jgi:predicted HAD superfamily hydrolase